MKINNDALFNRITAVLAKVLKISIEDISLDSLIMDDLGADSVEVWDIIVGLEKEFQIKFEQMQIDQVKKVSDIVLLIESKMNK